MGVKRVIALVTMLCLLEVAKAWPWDADKKSRKQDRVKRDRAQQNKGGPKRRTDGENLSWGAKEMTDYQNAEEILGDKEITDTITPEDDLSKSNAEIHKLWEQNMHDFVPEDMINFVVDHGTAQVFYEEINHTKPTLVKGAYYVNGGEGAQPLTGVIVQDPVKNVIYKRSDEVQGIILFNTTMPGEYSFVFANFDTFGTDKTVTFALHTYDEKPDPIEYDFTDDGERIIRNFGSSQQTGDNENLSGLADELAGDEEIGNVRNLLRTIQTSTKQIQTEAKMSLMRQDGHNQDLLDNGTWHFRAMLIEVAVFIAILAFQLHHLKGTLDNKLVL